MLRLWSSRRSSGIRHAGMIDQVRFCSQSYASLQLTRRLEPKVQVGYIAANALGDLAGRMWTS